jgi:DNA-binding NarL/FixJ family response regulator
MLCWSHPCQWENISGDATMKILHAVVADRHALVRAGVRAVLQTTPSVVIVGEASTEADVFYVCQQVRPQVLVLALNIPRWSAVVLVGVLRQQFSHMAVVILAAANESQGVPGLIEAGIGGYVLKEAPLDTLPLVIQLVASGNRRRGPWLPLPPAPAGGSLVLAQLAGLTDQEQLVLALLAQGRNTPQIADRLGLAHQTVRNYSSRVYAKLGIRSRAEDVVWAAEAGYGAGRAAVGLAKETG